MKALTLTQPWATLVAIGAKKIETRSWTTSFRGPLAIHVSRRVPREYRHLCGWGAPEPFKSTLEGHLWISEPGDIINYFGQVTATTRYAEPPERKHLGCVIAICDLICILKVLDGRVENIFIPHEGVENFSLPPSEPECSFGDYTPGRFAWILANIRSLPEPIPYKGSLGLWDFPDELLDIRKEHNGTNSM